MPPLIHVKLQCLLVVRSQVGVAITQKHTIGRIEENRTTIRIISKSGIRVAHERAEVQQVDGVTVRIHMHARAEARPPVPIQPGTHLVKGGDAVNIQGDAVNAVVQGADIGQFDRLADSVGGDIHRSGGAAAAIAVVRSFQIVQVHGSVGFDDQPFPAVVVGDVGAGHGDAAIGAARIGQGDTFSAVVGSAHAGDADAAGDIHIRNFKRCSYVLNHKRSAVWAVPDEHAFSEGAAALRIMPGIEIDLGACMSS